MIHKNDIPENVKNIYNDHLAYTRTFHRKPFKIRKNFKGFREDNRFRNYYQMAIWFERHPEINKQLFFEAYLHFHPDREAIPIKYYVHPNALTYYTKYIKVINSMDLDDERILKNAEIGVKFIIDFCEEKSITINQYLDFKEEGNATESWLKHVKESNVNIYSLFTFDDFFGRLKAIYKDIDIWNFYIESDTPFFFLRRWQSSKKFQISIETIINK